ncbi:MAG: acetolactate synthase, partial [Clostridia bacterium]|nr:acetolactate synthase [Clostridia bacterium]
MPVARMTAARALVECIRREGVDHVFCVPGESYLPVLDVLGELEAGGQVRVVSARHEEGAVFMADGYARATGRPGVVLATRGPGSTNLAIGLHTARHDSTPLVAFIGQVPTTFRHREALQEIDLVATFRPLTKWAVEVDRADRVAELAQRAFRVAQAGRPGPVLVSLPVDVLDGEADYAFRASTAPAPSRPDAAAVARAAELLAASERPAILAGGGVMRSRASDRLSA